MLIEGEIHLEPIPRLAYSSREKRSSAIAGAKQEDRVQPDFCIGAHAAVAGLPLPTQDTNRYTTYFPTLELIAPPRAK